MATFKAIPTVQNSNVIKMNWLIRQINNRLGVLGGSTPPVDEVATPGGGDLAINMGDRYDTDSDSQIVFGDRY